MRHLVLLAAGCLLPACSSMPSAPWSAPWTEEGPSQGAQAGKPPAPPEVRHLTVLIGQRDFEENAFEAANLDDQTALGVVYDAYPANTGHGYEIGFLRTDDDSTVAGVKIETRISELYFGYRKTFMLEEGQKFHPLVGAGFSILDGDFDFGPSDDDLAYAPYVHAGFTWDFAERLSVGFDIRLLFGHFDALGGIEADYSQMAATLGWRF
jgi:hypothetical protein